MAAVNASNGKTQWDRKTKYETFPIIHNNNLISESGMWDIKTGKPVERVNPITGEKELWEWSRTYGCNHPVASENLLTFRSGAASFYDLAEDGGVGNFGGFKSGCSINLIAADGVLSAPDYTRTCSCSYQNQTSLALVHMPDIEFWTSSSISYNSGERINRIGLNFGAPGDRKAGKTYWVDYPSVGGNSPDPDVEVNSEALWHLSNALRFGKDDYNWVYASTAENILSLSITVGESGGNSSKESTDTEKESAADPVVEAIPYTVKLFFAEHDDLSAGERVFSISLNRKKVCSDLDVVEETGAARRGLVKEFKNIVCTEDLEVDLTPKNGSKPPILAGIEIIRE
jgi:hypothetical protein